MCGINGVLSFGGRRVDRSTLHEMNAAIVHRGPDAGHVEVFANIGLGHRRLSIIDLSSHADQPMQSDSGRYSIVFNGEVYNFRPLRNELLEMGACFKTSSDTEVVLKAYEAWGDSCFSKFNGMFALAIADTETGEIVLARDPLGIKPLYLYESTGLVVFSSEIKAILKHSDVTTSVNKRSVAEYMWYGNTLGENTFYREISEVAPGTFVKFNKLGKSALGYFFKAENIEQLAIGEAEAIVRARGLLSDSVERHMVADVPVGIFLSGGVDSTAITAFASLNGERKVNTYTAAFDFQGGSNDLASARAMADLYKTNHSELSISGSDVSSCVEALVRSHDQPFGDAANVPLYMMTREINRDVKVILQGDGGDELFGGYSIYKTTYHANKWKKLSFISGLMRVAGLKGDRALQIRRFVEATAESNVALRTAMLLTMESNQTDPLQVFNPELGRFYRDVNVFQEFHNLYNQLPADTDDLKSVFLTDTKITLPKTFLEKVDKATMANSVEVRVPFLDKELLEFALSLPAVLKLANGEQKYILRNALRGVVPDYVLDRKKTGFGVPYAYWLSSSLRPFFLDHISTHVVRSILDVPRIVELLAKQEKGEGNYGFLLWKTLNLAIWINQSSPNFSSNN